MPFSPSKLSLSLTLGILTLSLASCDRGAPDAAQQTSTEEKSGGLTGKLDRAQAGQLMPALTIEHTDGRTLNLGALQGTPVLINLWATWCAPCVEEMPMLDEVAADYDGTLRVLTVSQDLTGAEKVGPFFEQGNFAHLEPWLDRENALSFHFGGDTVLPTTILYDANGMEVWRIIGGYDWSSAEARGLLDEALAGESAV